MNAHKAQYVLGKDSGELVEWGKWVVESAKNFGNDIDEVVKALDTADRVKTAGLTPKQFASLKDEIRSSLLDVQVKMAKVVKRMEPIAKKLSTEREKRRSP